MRISVADRSTLVGWVVRASEQTKPKAYITHRLLFAPAECGSLSFDRFQLNNATRKLRRRARVFPRSCIRKDEGLLGGPNARSGLGFFEDCGRGLPPVTHQRSAWTDVRRRLRSLKSAKSGCLLLAGGCLLTEAALSRKRAGKHVRLGNALLEKWSGLVLSGCD